MKTFSKWLLSLFLTCALAPASLAQGAPPQARTEPWPKEIVGLAETLPVQDGGRIKPLHTYASFMLLRLNGKRSFEAPTGEKIGAVEWLLDVLFFPEMAEKHPCFLVDDRHAIEAIGLKIEGKKMRDRYSFAELRPGVDKLFSLARQISRVEEKERDSTQQQVFRLAMNVDEFMRLVGHFDFARHGIQVGKSEGLAQVFGAADQTTFAEVLARAPALHALQDSIVAQGQSSPDQQPLVDLMRTTYTLATGTEALVLLPSTGPETADAPPEPAWLTPVDLAAQALQDGRIAPEHLAMITSLEALVGSTGDMKAFERELAGFRSQVVPVASSHGEYEKIPLELSYYHLDLLGKGQAFFVLAFLLTAALWIWPRNKTLYVATSVAVLVPTLLLVAAITMRCLIRGRPPVSTLYETVLFVTATGALTALVTEWITRQKIALSSAAVLGMIGLFIASGYETLDKKDTMPQLVAVLDTNFWLATHVTAITVGYAAGVLAALLASLYLLSKVLGIKRAEPGFYKVLARIVYGVLCFGLIFSAVGTILGGVWANESWGRFWGWDPKENGALLIVLSQLVILHARMGGLIRDFGMCMLAAFGGTVIGFSWFGVNLLGVGLHSYGFTSGISTVLWSYYYVQWGVVALGGVYWVLERVRQKAALAAQREQAAGTALRPGGEPST